MINTKTPLTEIHRHTIVRSDDPRKLLNEGKKRMLSENQSCPFNIEICPFNLSRYVLANMEICPFNMEICPCDMKICPCDMEICPCNMEICPCDVKICLFNMEICPCDMEIPLVFGFEFNVEQYPACSISVSDIYVSERTKAFLLSKRNIEMSEFREDITTGYSLSTENFLSEINVPK